MPDPLRILTVFFGLTVGVVPVAVEVGPSVARVEFAVDGTKVAAVDGPPWSAPVDFGPAALPARLEARALDVEGGEVAREVALVNRPFPRDGAAFEILSDRAGYPRRVRLLWDAVLNAEPAWVRVALDGEILLDGIGTDVMLPAWDESRVHILTVEIERLDGGHDMAAAAFGGELGCEPLWSLTPVVLQMREGGAEPEVELLEKVLTVAGDPSDVLAVRREPPRLWMVRDPEADRLASWSIYHLESNPLYWGRWATLQGMRGHRAPEGSVLRYVAPQSTGTPEAPQFMVGPGLDISDSAFVWFVGAEMEENFSDSTTINLAGAVIVAAREAAAAAAPRAVLLSLEREHRDETPYPAPQEVVRQMRELGVPLEVWRQRKPRERTRLWPTGEDARRTERLVEVSHSMLDRLRRQRVVWVRGEWLPRDFEMADNTAGLTIAGRGAENPGRSAP
jgi:hypothetical protein